LSRQQFLCISSDLLEGEFRELEATLADAPCFLILTRFEGQPRAWLNICPHAGRPLNWAPNRFLSDPTGNLVCAAHGAVFEPDQGKCIAGPCLNDTLTAIKLIEQDGEIYLDSH
jgi:nitrite reductase/ring-hydroxylating ferredoxin subunit